MLEVAVLSIAKSEYYLGNPDIVGFRWALPISVNLVCDINKIVLISNDSSTNGAECV